jgi:hypothetical protein
MSEENFKPVLGLRDATMLVAGSMIGSGIFIVSADILRNVGGAGWMIVVWLITGFMTISAAVSYGELSGMFPKAGGQYVYLREAFNPLIAFLYGWSFFAVLEVHGIPGSRSQRRPGAVESWLLFHFACSGSFDCNHCVFNLRQYPWHSGWQGDPDDFHNH